MYICNAHSLWAVHVHSVGARGVNTVLGYDELTFFNLFSLLSLNVVRVRLNKTEKASRYFLTSKRSTGKRRSYLYKFGSCCILAVTMTIEAAVVAVSIHGTQFFWYTCIQIVSLSWHLFRMLNAKPNELPVCNVHIFHTL